MGDEKNPDLIAFGIVIKDRRKELKITQEQLSLYTRIDRSYISEIENGIKNPSLTTILMLARALHLKPSELLKQFENSNSHFDSENR
ncbi:helix-turn-helix domain-containing protein [Paenibacillus sp. GXUN7292]|uniref:helix-turn-helix domain-containing protein n=1 Tax=Paenibacillus sp. GXUN7292 TaxID=3422499 RepID=UPI003D7CFC6C